MRGSCCPVAAPRRSFVSSSGASSTIAAARRCHEPRPGDLRRRTRLDRVPADGAPPMSEASAILTAMYEGNTDALAALLAARPELDVFEAAARGAAAGGDVGIIDMLLIRGARVGARAEDGRTPLAIAEERGHTAAARRLRGEMP